MVASTPFNTFISGLPVASAVNNADLLYVEQGGTSKQVLASTVQTYSQTGTPFSAANSTIFNVKNYGAKGDGVTDDTAAVNSAIAAFNTATKGALYFPTGKYIIPGGALTAITANGTVFGDGEGASNITSQHATATLFTINSLISLGIRDIDLANTATTTAGFAISQTNGTSSSSKLFLTNVTIAEFWNGVDCQVCGGSCSFVNVFVSDSGGDAYKIQNINNADAGSILMLQCGAFWGVRNGINGIHALSGGALNITGCTFAQTNPFGITNSIITVNYSNLTGDIWISNCALEAANAGANCVNIQSTHNVTLMNNEIFFPNGTTTALVFSSVNELCINGVVADKLLGTATIASFSSCTAVSISNCAMETARWNGPTGLTALNQIDGLRVPTTGQCDVTTLLTFAGVAAGCRFIVNNSSATPTLGQTVVGGDNGGTNTYPVYSDGTNWKYG